MIVDNIRQPPSSVLFTGIKRKKNLSRPDHLSVCEDFNEIFFQWISKVSFQACCLLMSSFPFQTKVKAAEITEKTIDETRSQYIPVAINSQILFFCVADMAKIDPMYQYSLEWFVSIFLSSIAQAERAGNNS